MTLIADPAIRTVESLRTHLQTALEVEHATIPPYLCALYSIPEGTNAEAAAVIQSVVMEEMLHMTLVANLLNAVGGHPRLAFREFLAPYPKALPHSNDIVAELRPFSVAALTNFLAIEHPEKVDAPPEADGFHTIGQFYAAVRDAIELLAFGHEPLFTGHANLQIPSGRWYYGGGGTLIPVTDLDSARAAIREIVEQGEGLHHSIFDADQVPEYAHYFRFNELLQQRRYTATDTPRSGPTGDEIPVDYDVVAPMQHNPKTADYREYPTIRREMQKGNRIYTRLLRQLELAFNGSPQALREAVPIMYEFRYQAQALMRIPNPLAPGTTVGPSFEFDPDTPFS